MNILDLSNVRPLLFGFTEQPQTYDFETPEKLLARLKQVAVHPVLEFLVEDYEMEYFVYSAPQYVTSINEYGAPLAWKDTYEPRAHRVSLHPKLFLLCLRCPLAKHTNQVHVRELIHHLEAEVLRRKLRALID